MKSRFSTCASLALVRLSIAGNAGAVDTAGRLSPMPALRRHTAPLDASLRALRACLLQAARDCDGSARGMDATAHYHVGIRKTIETPFVAGLEVTASAPCDGAHPSGYQYGIAYRIADGKRLDLNEIYAAGRREGGRLFLTEKSVVPVMAGFGRVSAAAPGCAELLTSGDRYWMAKPFTLAVRADGNLQFHFDTAYVEAACFASIRLDAQAFAPFKNRAKAAAYALP